MFSFFSFLMSALFVGFILAAIVGHALLIGALLRPFFGKLDLRPFLMWHGLRCLPDRLKAKLRHLSNL